MLGIATVCLVLSATNLVLSSPEVKLADESKSGDRPIVFKQAPVDLGDLLLDYDKKLRPYYGGRPVNIGLSMHVARATWAKNNLNLQVYFREKWTDPRLVFRSKATNASLNIVKESMGLIWTPDTFSPSVKSMTQMNEGGIRLTPSGQVKRSRMFDIDLPCPISVDHVISNGSQKNCSLEFESYWFSTDDINIGWENRGVTWSRDQCIRSIELYNRIAQLKIGSYDTAIVDFAVETGVTKEVLDFLLSKGIGVQ